MQDKLLKENERAIVIAIGGNMEFQNFLLAHGISLGTVITKNYSPGFSKLINFSVSGKMLSLRKEDFALIEYQRI